MKYNYNIYFKRDNNINVRYHMHFEIEANSNKEAVAEGNKRWEEKRPKGNITIVKVSCRKKETEPRRRKPTILQQAVSALNKYFEEELDQCN